MWLTWLDACVVGALVGGTLHLMRQSIDRERGVLAETLAMGLPLLLAFGYVVSTAGSQRAANVIGLRMAPMVELVFLSLPVLLAGRLTERLRRGGQFQIADMFRWTTAAAITLFVVNSLQNPFGLADILTLNAIYLAAEFASHSRRVQRNLASVFSLGLIACICVNLILGRSPVAWLSFEDLSMASSSWRLDESTTGLVGLVLFVASCVAAPVWMRQVARRCTPLSQLGLVAAAWRMRGLQPAAAIAVRPTLDLWSFRAGVCYLNHGSFGAVPLHLRTQQQRLRSECDDEPLDFLARQLETRWYEARLRLAAWVGTQPENIAFCENATAGMNDVAHCFPLSAEDEVLINDHEYGAVQRIWQRKCQQVGARLVTAQLPLPATQPDQIVQAILNAVTTRTKLVVVSHITSPTAIILPVEQLCTQLKPRAIPICIDGPHALLQQRFKLHTLECDFYTASCHKWLCAPLGSGFVYVAPHWQTKFAASRLSWGRLQPAQPESWSDEMLWTGTRDYSAYLCVPQAIDLFQRFDWQWLDQRNHALACYAREQLARLAGAEPVTPEGREWFGWMVAVWLPPGDHSTLQRRLWERYRIEVPIVHFAERWLVRVSCHLYNTTADIDRLHHALRRELGR
jgi:isopenicillin-N epimerase